MAAVRDIEQADLLAIFTIDPLGPAKPRGGRHWETGFARGLGKEVVVIGPRENIFHFLPEVKQFDSKEDAKQYLYSRSIKLLHTHLGNS